MDTKRLSNDKTIITTFGRSLINDKMIHSKYNTSRIVIRFLVMLFTILGLQNQTLQAQSGCVLVDTVCTTGTTDYFVDNDGMSTYTWSTNNGATLIVPAGDTSVIVDWSTSTVSNGLDSVCVSSNGVCLTCRVSYIEECSVPCTTSFGQAIKRKGAPTLCERLMADPSHPLAIQDCDGGGQNNLIECNAGQNPENPSDDCIEQSIDKVFVPYIATGSLTRTFGPGQCLDNININGTTATTWTDEINSGASGGNSDVLTYTAGTTLGDMICDNSAAGTSDNGWITTWASSNTVNLQDPGVSCFEVTLMDDLDGHFNMGWQEIGQVGNYNGGCRVTHEGNTLLNWHRTNSAMSGFAGYGVEPWIQTGWTLANSPPVPMVFKICLDSNTNDFIWYVNDTEIDRKAYPGITCP